MATNVFSFVDKSQADGAQTAELGTADRFFIHQVQAQVSAAPAAGVLEIYIKTPGAAEFVKVGQIDLTDPTTFISAWEAFTAEVKAVPVGFDGDKTYSLYGCSGAGL
jgi:hypothetical protein